MWLMLLIDDCKLRGRVVAGGASKSQEDATGLPV